MLISTDSMVQPYERVADKTCMQISAKTLSGTVELYIPAADVEAPDALVGAGAVGTLL